MEPKNNGGPAFPVHGGHEGDDPRNQIIGGGMTLRDYLAAKAMHGICAHSDTWGLATAGKIATAAYEMADAMLLERVK
jgi:hypothetical protein